MQNQNRFDSFLFPAIRTAIVFGFDSIEKLPEQLARLGVSRPLIVTDPGIEKTGIVDAIRRLLEGAGRPAAVFSRVPQDSSVAVVEEALGILQSGRCDGVLGIGGGSSMDTAKCVAIRATDDTPLKELAGLGKVRRQPLPVIAVPTTAGTGSEVSYWAVTKDDATGNKFSVGGEPVFPRVALCDPLLTIGLPPTLTATTGMDALTHAVESYTNRSYQPISEALSYRAIELIGANLLTAVKSGGDRDARFAMMLGSMLAGLAMNPTRLGAVHALAMPLGSGTLGVPHGAANAVMLPHVMEFNIPAAPKKYAMVAKALGVEAHNKDDEALAAEGLAIIRSITAALDIPARMGELGLTRAAVPGVCEEAMKSGNIAVNPRPITQAELEEICYRAL